MVDTKRDALHAAADAGRVVLAVCGGYQLLGHHYELGEERIPGVGLVDLHTVREDGPRLIGNVAIEVRLPGLERRADVLAGFENHGGRTHLGPGAQPLGRVLKGHGNTGASGFEGVLRDHVDRHLPARPAAAQERVVRRLADRHRARARGAAGGRSRTSSSAPRTPMPAGWRASEAQEPIISH